MVDKVRDVSCHLPAQCRITQHWSEAKYVFQTLKNAIIILAQRGQHAGVCVCQDEVAEMNLPQ